MKIHTNLDELPAFKNAVVTIGTFDGVHEGHRQIIYNLKETAEKIGGETVIITFHPHPRKIVSSAILGIRLINTLDERLELLGKLEMDHVVIIPFTPAFANQPAEEYIRSFLVGRFSPHTIIIGYDHRFGRNREGDYQLMEKMAPLFNYELKEIPRQLLNEIGISSTRIREAIVKGETAIADKLLGYSFFFSGKVVHGDKLGRQLGYPTANIQVKDEEKIIPGDGIYAVYASLQDPESPQQFKGMMSIGFRPTVDGKKRVIEVNLFDFDGDIYGKELRISLKKYLRPELKFDSLALLIQQIDQDKKDSLAIL